MVVLLKKQVDTRDWPCLQKAEGILPYIKMDFGLWTWEDDESGGNMSSKTEIHSIWKNNEWNSMQVKHLPARFEVKHILMENSQRTLTTVRYFSRSASSVWEI